MTPRALPLVATLLFGCTPDEPVVRNGVALDGTATGYAVHGDDGGAPNAVVVRAVNDFGVAFGGGTVTLTVDGSPRQVAIDAFGYGTFSLAEPGSVTVDGSGDTLLHATEVDWVGPGLPPAVRGHSAPGQVEAVRGGAVAVVGRSLVWTGPGLPTHPVATLEASIDGATTLQIDGDGVLDAIVWGGDAVLLLKGRPGGGLGWGFGVQAIGWSAEAAGAGDFDDDGDADLVIAWTGPAGNLIQFWTGDGVWSFEPAHERALNGSPVDLTVGRDAYDGSTVATVLTDGVPWQRFVRTSDGGWLVSGPTLDVGATQGWRILGGADINANALDDLVVFPPRVAGAGRTLQLWDVSGDQAQHLDLTESGAHIGVGDANGDGLRNVWMLEDTEQALRILTWDETRYLVRDAGTLPHFGPMAVSDFDDDGVDDLLVAGASWAWHPGAIDADDGDRWGAVPPAYDIFDLDLVGPVAAIETGAGADELVGVTSGGEGTRLSHWAVTDDGPVAAAHIPIDPAGGAGIDLAVCGERAWVLLNTRLVEVDVDAATVRGTREVADPRGISCGQGPDGAVSALLDGSSLVLLGADLAEVDTRDGTGIVDVALLDRGSGPEVVTCTEACLAWAWSDAGTGGVVTWSADAVFLDGEPIAPGAVRVGAQDIDGDARPDLVLRAEGGFLGVIRTTGVGISPSRWWHGDPDWTGAPAVAGSPGMRGSFWLRRDELLVRTE